MLAQRCYRLSVHLVNTNRALDLAFVEVGFFVKIWRADLAKHRPDLMLDAVDFMFDRFLLATCDYSAHA